MVKDSQHIKTKEKVEIEAAIIADSVKARKTIQIITKMLKRADKNAVVNIKYSIW